jgi:4-hydroxymandelate oxidase
VLRPSDALRAVEAGADAVVVSNHGGRQLDRAPASVDALGSVVDAVDGRAEVLLDSGVRRGADVAVALALGARAVLIGRPMLWGLAAGGETGVRRSLEILRDELANVLALVGCPAARELDRSFLWRPDGVEAAVESLP